ncbi:hypothetical protein NQ315_001641 [Exocentrus adspersus]|uniref:BED-type domain-containing protein n=1 Tax=Exocentrus adspersus TaxID=1586481 RepID=A0AAV8W9B3_9CUCU|nr:hypothetical protein NQ315_001641 [Exocentrus adspersus]
MDSQKKPRKRSSVWNIFLAVNQSTAYCKLCNRSITYKSSTSNLKRHIKAKHPSKLEEPFSEGADTDAHYVFVVEPDANEAVSNKADPEWTPESASTAGSPVKISNKLNRKKSVLWNYFIPLNQDRASCNTCGRTLCYKTSANLRRHMELRHPEVHIPRSSEGSYIPSASTSLMVSKMENKKKSASWRFFSRIDDNLACCNICKDTISYKNSTSNLKRHVVRKHPNIHIPTELQNTASDEAETLSSIEQKWIQCDVPQDSSPQQNKLKKCKTVSGRSRINEILLKLFTVDYQPFDIVEDKGFQIYVKALNASYVLPTKHFITNSLLPEVYEETLAVVQQIVSTAQSVTVTMEFWVSVYSEHLMSITVHFINENFEKQSALLDCAAFEEGCTSLDYVEELKRITTDWGLENKVLLTVSNNNDNNFGREIKEQLNWDHFDCYAHTLNTIILDGLKPAEPLLSKFRSLVAWFRDSPASVQLLSYQEQSECAVKKLILDFPTRWNSTFDMIQRLLELKDAISSSITELESSTNTPVITEEEWQLLKDIKVVLEPMDSATKIMSEQNYICISSIIILTEGLERVYKDMEKRELSTLALDVVREFLKGVQIRFGDLEMSETLLISTFLDPRFKNVGFSSDAVAEAARKTVENLVYDKMVEMKSTPLSLDPIEVHITDSKHGLNVTYNTTSSSESISIWSHFDEKAMAVQPSGTDASRAAEEVHRYLEDGLLERNGDPLAWWKEHSYKYPYLKKVVVEKLGTTATSVPCDRLFSKRGADVMRSAVAVQFQ